MREIKSLDRISLSKAQNEGQRHLPICCVCERKGLLRWGDQRHFSLLRHYLHGALDECVGLDHPFSEKTFLDA